MEDVEEGKRIIFKGKILVTISSVCISLILLWWGLSKLEDARKEENFIVYAAENDDYEKLEELLESGHRQMQIIIDFLGEILRRHHVQRQH